MSPLFSQYLQNLLIKINLSITDETLMGFYCIALMLLGQHIVMYKGARHKEEALIINK